MLSNIFAVSYYIYYLKKYKNQSTLSINIKHFSAQSKICTSVLGIGIPAALGALIMDISTMFINKLMAGYGDMALAGIGVATKITMVTGMICMGIGQGIQPVADILSIVLVAMLSVITSKNKLSHIDFSRDNELLVE